MVKRKAKKKKTTKAAKKKTTKATKKKKTTKARKKTTKAAPKVPRVTPASKPRTKSEIYNTLAGQTGLARKEIQSVFDALGALLATDLSKRGPGVMQVPGLMEDITLVNVNFSLSPALISGQVDAVIGAFRNFELNQMDIVGRPGRAFFVEEEGVPVYDELIFIAHSDRLGDQRLRAFIDAIEAATLYLINHPEESWKLFIAGRAELDDELNRRAWRDTLPRFALRPAAYDAERYERFAEFLQDQGLIAEALPAEAYGVELR